MDSTMPVKKPKYQYVANKNCKTCYGRGQIVRTKPIDNPRKKMMQRRIDNCGCVVRVPIEKGGE